MLKRLIGNTCELWYDIRGRHRLIMCVQAWFQNWWDYRRKGLGLYLKKVFYQIYTKRKKKCPKVIEKYSRNAHYYWIAYLFPVDLWWICIHIFVWNWLLKSYTFLPFVIFEKILDIHSLFCIYLELIICLQNKSIIIFFLF